MTRIYESLSELDTLLKGVKKHFLYSDEIAAQILVTLNQDAVAHSDKLEPDCDHITTLSRLNKALDYVIDEFDKPISVSFIREISEIIHPSNMGFRRSTAHIIGAKGRYIMINPEKIVRELEKVVLYLAEDNGVHPALKAAQFHHLFALIHPFDDGNGRTIRLLQNIFLYKHGIPPATILNTERPTYLNHIEDATIAFRDRNGQEEMFSNYSHPEYRFFEYMVDKIKSTTELLSSKISHLNKYKVTLTFKKYNKIALGKVKEGLHRFLSSHHGEPHFCNNNGDLYVTTSAAEESIIGYLQKYKNGNKNLCSYDVATWNKK